MPTYVYTCDSCSTQFEQFQSFKDSPLQVCPHCSQESVRRVFQPVGIVFKGAGWYITDSRNDNKGGNGKSSTSTHKDETSSSETKSDTESKTSDTSNASAPSTSSSESSTTSASDD